MNQSVKDQIKSISKAVSIVDDYSFTVFDRQVHVAYQQPYQKWDKPLENFGANTGQKDQLKVNLKSQLSAVIYSAFYVEGRVHSKGMKSWESHHQVPNQGGRDAFIDELSAHNHSSDGVDASWRVYALDPQGNAFVEKNGDVRQLIPNSYEMANPTETALNVNTLVNIKRTKEYREAQPTFYHVNSEALMPTGEEIGRFYWNIEAEGAKYLVEQVSQLFNHYRVPFMFKCTNHPELYTRSDGAVLYVSRKQFRIATQLIKKMMVKLKPFLKKEVPLFSRRLCDGLSYAEDPGLNQSFGMSRSEIIAEGIVNAYYLRRNNKSAQFGEILNAFKEHGLDINHPYLKPNSHWDYNFNFLDH